MPRHMRSRRAEMESVERRILLAAMSDVIASAIARVSDLTQYSKAELREAREWAVSVEGVGNISRLQHLLGATKFHDSGILQDIYIATFPQTRTGQSIARGLETYNPNNVAWPLIIQPVEPRLIPNDPQFPNQWHLRNTGQGGGLVGADANIVNAWDNYQGNGVVIGIVDDGVAPTHPDLSPSYRADLSWDYVGNDPDPSGGSHGVNVAGVAGARGNNSVGVTGAAFMSQHAGLKLLGATSDTNVANALTFKKNDIHIYNNSWGPSDSGNVLGGAGPLAAAALQDAAFNGRSGLGNIFVWAGGNGGNNDNVNYDSYANSRYTVAVAAINNHGVRSSYSEQGAPLLVGASSSGGSLGITTTSGTSSYSSSFGGTSSASPLAAGVIALMLQANPSLTWRDVQHILVNSSRKNDPTHPDWTTNGAGHLVNHFYGYGHIDAQAAVAMAQTWANVGPEVSATTGTITVNQAIPNLNTTGISHTFQVTDPIKLETVEVVFNATHPRRGQLQVFLTSPSGTVSVLATKRSDTGANYNNWVFSTKRSWDEDPRGTWTIRVTDDAGAESGTFNSYKVNLYGSQLVTSPSVYGTVYDDVNGNGVRDPGEGGIAGVQVYIDSNNNGVFDTGEPMEMTLASGGYSLVDLELGQHTVRIVPPTGLRITAPAAGSYAVDLTAGQNFSMNNNFALVNPRITGSVFNDSNDNGQQDTGETGRASVTVYLDSNNNGTLDAGERTATTTSAGAYEFGGMADGNYTVRIVTPSGTRQTHPTFDANNSYSVSITPLSLFAPNNVFGVTDRARVAGVVYNDANNNGVLDSGETGIPNIRVYQDINNNGLFDQSGGTFASTNVPLPVPPGAPTSTSGITTSTLDIGGVGQITNLAVNVGNLSHTFTGDLIITLISPAGTRVQLFNRRGGSGDNLINTVFSDAAASPISSGTAPFTGTWRPEQPLSALNGQNGSGTWRLEVNDAAAGDHGMLNSWSLTVESMEPNMMSGANGEYLFAALPAAQYAVRQVPIDGNTQTQPASGVYNLDLQPGASVADAHFGNSTAAAPIVNQSSFTFDGANSTLPNPPHKLAFAFSQQVGQSIDPSDLQLVNTTTNTTVSTASIAVAYDVATRTATFTFPGYTDGILPDGNYTATLLAAGITVDGSGTPMTSNYVTNFFVLAGDANHDGIVNLADFNILAANFGQSPRIFSQGDFNYDGVVNLADFNILAARFGQSLNGNPGSREVLPPPPGGSSGVRSGAGETSLASTGRTTGFGGTPIGPTRGGLVGDDDLGNSLEDRGDLLLI